MAKKKTSKKTTKNKPKKPVKAKQKQKNKKRKIPLSKDGEKEPSRRAIKRVNDEIPTHFLEEEDDEDLG